jgi:thiosulfate dehydrogenase
MKWGMTTMNRTAIGVLVCTALLYASVIAFGLRLHDLSSYKSPIQDQRGMNWHPPSDREIPLDAAGTIVRRGQLLFNETPLYAAEHVQARVSCANCHAAGGMQPFASPMVGVAKTFPQFNARAGHIISLEDRIQECFVRSENGKPLDYNGTEMKAIVKYIDWVSQPRPGQLPFHGRGLAKLPNLTPDPVQGGAIYAAQCAGCHGNHGEGIAPQFPPLWGAASFNDGAGMNTVTKMAAFVQQNMPQNRKGGLTAQEAYDVAAYIHMQPRPAFNKAYAHY